MYLALEGDACFPDDNSLLLNYSLCFTTIIDSAVNLNSRSNTLTHKEFQCL